MVNYIDKLLYNNFIPSGELNLSITKECDFIPNGEFDRSVTPK